MTERGKESEDSGLTDLERRVLQTLFASYPNHDSLNVRSVGKVDHTPDPDRPALWDLHREPGLLETIDRLHDRMMLKREVDENSGFLNAIILPDGMRALKGSIPTTIGDLGRVREIQVADRRATR